MALFPPPSRRRRRQSRRRPAATVERLEPRQLLAVDIVRTSDTQRFAIDIHSADQCFGEYHSFEVTNNDPVGYTDVWLRITDIPLAQKVQLGPGEDGLYFLGDLPAGASQTAFIYFTAEQFTVPAGSDDPQTFVAEVRQGDPLAGPVLGTLDNAGWLFVAEAVEDNSSSVTASVDVTYAFAGNPVAVPIVGGTMTMIVTGNVKNKPDRILFSPASTLDWPADAFVLTSTQVDYFTTGGDPLPGLPPDWIFEKPVADKPKNFVATYTFAIAGATASPTPVAPKQYSAHGGESRKFDHSRLLGGVVPIPIVTGEIDITKVSLRGGVPVETYIAGALLTYEIVISNPLPVAVGGVSVSDVLPAALDLAQTTLFVDYGDNSGTLALVGDTLGGTIDMVAGGLGVSPITITIETFVVAGTTGPLVNTVTATLPDESTVSATVTNFPDIVLAVTKTSSGGGTYVQGEPLQYTITITNSDSLNATGVVVTDVFPAALVAASTTWYATYVGGASGDLTDDPANPGTGPIAGTVDIPIGGSLTITVDTVVALDAGDPITNTVTAAVPDGLTFSASVTDDPDATIELDKVSTSPVGPGFYTAGGPLTYTITVGNPGPADVFGLRLNDVLPEKLDVQPTEITVDWGGNPAGIMQLVDGNISGLFDVARGTTVTVTVATTVPPLTTGTLVNTVETITSWGDTAFAEVEDDPRPGEGEAATVIGTDDGCNFPPVVHVLDAFGTIIFTIDASQGLFEPTFRGSVRVTTGDVNGDGAADIIVGSGRSRPGEVRVFLASGPGPYPSFTYDAGYTFRPFGNAYRGGIEVAAGDFTGDGLADIIVGQSSGRGLVRGYAVSPTLLPTGRFVASSPAFQFQPYGGRYAGGVMVAAADFNGDGRVEVVVGPNAGIVAQVRVYDVTMGPRVVSSFRPFGGRFSRGVTLAIGSYANGMSPDDGVPDIFVGTGAGGGSILEVYGGQAVGGVNPRLARLTAFASLTRQNARLFVAPLDLGGTGTVTDIFGVTGLNGGGGTRAGRGINAAGPAVVDYADARLRPPLRIAPFVRSQAMPT
ncbi:MAG: FG-GAP-like repeat-containing protein [Pirellulales bacterium]